MPLSEAQRAAVHALLSTVEEQTLATSAITILLERRQINLLRAIREYQASNAHILKAALELRTILDVPLPPLPGEE